MSDYYIALAITCTGLILSALYSGLETGLYTINRIRLDVRSSSGLVSAKRILSLVDNPTRMLAVLLVCNNAANYLASYGAAMFLDSTTLSPWISILVNAGVMIPLLFIFGEVLPKDLFRTHTDSWTYACSVPLSWSDRILRWTGIVPVLSKIGQVTHSVLGSESPIEPTPRRRFGLLFKEGLGDGVLSDEQITLADRILAMRSLTVNSEMIPWTRVVCIGKDMPLGRRTTALSKTSHTRIPVVNSDGMVEGILPVLSALLEPNNPTEELIIEPLYVTPKTKVQDALHQLRKSGKVMAIVSLDGEKPLGIVTLKDLVEPIVGELAAW
jgi:CBS domain containing-hemolysin-like protein|tara:strand:- start:496 stop:1473 length:978 start_codon:yes stop_codon:yes gene_type:complete